MYFILLSLSIIFQFCCQSKVPYFQLHVIIEKEIAKFEISVNYLVLLVEMFDTQEKLKHEVTGFRLSNCFPPFV